MDLPDEVRCRYPLPISGANDLAYQTTSLPEPGQCLYEIRADGTLWAEHCDLGYQEDEPQRAIGDRTRECMWRINRVWYPYPYTGEIVFCWSPRDVWKGEDYLEFSAYFIEGVMQRLVQLHGDKPPAVIMGKAAMKGSEDGK